MLSRLRQSFLGRNSSVARRWITSATCTDLLERVDKIDTNMSLPREFYVDDTIYQAEMETIFHHEWLWAGVDSQVAESGSWFSMQAGNYPVFVIRGKDGEVRAFHNVCRHRGYRLCQAPSGKTKGRRVVCPYHQWSYDINDGELKFARDMGSEFDPSSYGLKPVHLENVNGFLYVNVSSEPPEFPKILRDQITAYTEPFSPQTAKVAVQQRIIEKGNWKYAWENNRECYHCPKSHPELWQFPSDAGWLAASTDPEEIARAKQCDELNLPSAFWVGDDYAYRFMRLNLTKGADSFSMDGKPLIAKRMGRMPPQEELHTGSMLFYHYPMTWQHWLADHAIVFRLVPISPSETELLTTWLVPGDAEEGVDYNVDDLVKVWEATNDQDRNLIQGAQLGVQSPAYQSGPYSPLHEGALIEFQEWYTRSLKRRLPSVGTS